MQITYSTQLYNDVDEYLTEHGKEIEKKDCEGYLCVYVYEYKGKTVEVYIDMDGFVTKHIVL